MQVVRVILGQIQKQISVKSNWDSCQSQVACVQFWNSWAHLSLSILSISEIVVKIFPTSLLPLLWGAIQNTCSHRTVRVGKRVLCRNKISRNFSFTRSPPTLAGTQCQRSHDKISTTLTPCLDERQSCQIKCWNNFMAKESCWGARDRTLMQIWKFILSEAVRHQMRFRLPLPWLACHH